MIYRSDSTNPHVQLLLKGLAVCGISALIAAWAGCGPSVSSGGSTSGHGGTTGAGDTSGAGAAGGTDTTTTNNQCPANKHCPQIMPSAQTPCSNEGLCCPYVGETDHMGGENEVYLTCVNGMWQ